MNQPPSLHQNTYFPHIDGIRAIAVLAVVLYHIRERTCPGGFVGVDIFFVLSGYLITKGLIKESVEGDVLDQRLLPASHQAHHASLLLPHLDCHPDEWGCPLDRKSVV